MLQVIQNLRSGAIEVVELPDPPTGAGRVLVGNQWSVISAGTEGAISRVAKKSLLGKARERPQDARRVLGKISSDGLRSTRDAVEARLADSLTPGYSSMGVVIEAGEGVSGFSPGDRVGCVGANFACHAERVAVPSPLCIPLPDSLGDREGAFGALGAIAAHGVRLAGVGAGDVVAVIGLGLVGQLTCQIATAAGARVLAIDTDGDRVDLAVELGALAGSAAAPDEALAIARTASRGSGADAVLIAAATPSSEPLGLAAELARDRATVCAIGDVGLDVPRAAFYEKELHLLVSRSYGPGRYDAAYEEDGQDYPIGYVRWTERRLISYFFEEVASGRIRLEPLMTHEFGVEDADKAYEALAEPARLAVMVRYPDGSETAKRTTRVGPAAERGLESGDRRPRLALIGPGDFARSVLMPRLAKLDVELVAVVGRSPARAAAAAKRFGAETVATDPAELIGDPGIDAVVVATQHDSHAELAAAALRQGKAVFVEKPLAIDEAGLADVEEALAPGGRLVVGFNRSVAPVTRRLRDHFAGRGDPLYLDCRVNAGELPADHWLADPERGGGRLVGEGCHFVDLASAVIGEPLLSVQVAIIGPGPSAAGSDSFALTLRYSDGSVATVAYLDQGSPKMPKERIEVIGAGRSATIDDFRSIDVYAKRRRQYGRMRHLPLAGQDKGHTNLLASTVDFFRGQGDAPIPYERMLETTRATLLARDALARGEPGPIQL